MSQRMPEGERESLNRRDFVGHIGGILTALSAPALVRSSQAASEKRPNILVIMSDEHDPAVMGCYGDAHIRTPHMDGLAAGGVTFDNCYTNSPLCVPSRLSFLAGKYCSRIGAWSNNCWLPSDDYATLPQVLGAQGYECCLSGKMHLDSTRRHGLRELFPASTNDYKKTGTGGRRKPTDMSVNKKSWANRSSDFRIGDRSQVMDHDRDVTRYSREFLSNRTRGDKPFFLIAGYLSPHFPLVVPRDHYKRYQDKIAMPEIPRGHLEGQVLNYQHVRRGFGTTEATDAQTKLGRECYWALTDWFDREIGELMHALQQSAAADNTLVVYTSDHGENKGDHGMWWKNCMYETAARVPLIARWPGRWDDGSRRSNACSLVDVVQTVLDAAGSEPPEDWDGRPLSSVLDDPQANDPDFAVSEYFAHNIASGFTMLRTGRYKYVYHTRMDKEHGPERELYDVQADPGEFTNLAARTEHRKMIEELHGAMLKEVGRDPDETERICRADYARGYGRAG